MSMFPLFPEVHRKSQLPVLLKRLSTGAVGSYSSRMHGGRGYETALTRPYHIGDKQSWIDWRRLARTEGKEIYVKVPFSLRDFHIDVILDLTHTMDWGLVGGWQRELLFALAAYLAFGGIDAGIFTTIDIVGEKCESRGCKNHGDVKIFLRERWEKAGRIRRGDALIETLRRIKYREVSMNVLFLLSDFLFDEEEGERIKNLLPDISRYFDIVPIRIVDWWMIEVPPIEGLLEIMTPYGKRTILDFGDKRVREAYARSIREQQEMIDGIFRDQCGEVLTVTLRDGFDEAFRRVDALFTYRRIRYERGLFK